MSVWKALFDLFTVSMHLKKNSPLAPFIANTINRMTETGIKSSRSKRYPIPEPNCEPLYEKGHSLGMEKFGSLFALYLIGCIISLIVLWIEINFQPSKTLPPQQYSNENELCQKIEAFRNELHKGMDLHVATNKALLLLKEAESAILKK